MKLKDMLVLLPILKKIYFVCILKLDSERERGRDLNQLVYSPDVLTARVRLIQKQEPRFFFFQVSYMGTEVQALNQLPLLSWVL